MNINEIFDIEIKPKNTSNLEWFRQLGDKYGLSPKSMDTKYYAWRKRKNAGLPIEVKTASVNDMVNSDIEQMRERSKIKALEDKYKYVLKELELSHDRFDTLVGIKEEIEIINIEPSFVTSVHEVCPAICLSDWHFEERVDGFTVNDLNEYNLEIAQARWFACIQNSLKLIAKERKSSEIKKVVVWLGGDFITGYIHEELEEGNYLSPTEATRFAKKMIISALKFLKEHGNFTEINVVCNYGNHGRTNKKPRVATAYKNSYEWMMYKDVEDYFANDRLFKFLVSNGMTAYFKVFDTTVRTMHGDNIKYGGGIGGLTVPLRKALFRLDDQCRADYTIMGHYHQCHEATENCFVNGSGIGINAYAQRIGARPEHPLQAFKIFDKKYGPTGTWKIRCE